MQPLPQFTTLLQPRHTTLNLLTRSLPITQSQLIGNLLITQSQHIRNLSLHTIHPHHQAIRNLWSLPITPNPITMPLITP